MRLSSWYCLYAGGVSVFYCILYVSWYDKITNRCVDEYYDGLDKGIDYDDNDDVHDADEDYHDDDYDEANSAGEHE